MSTSSIEYRFAQFRFLVLSLCVLSVLCVKTFSQDYKSVHDGVEYAELTREISGKQVKMNLLRLDLKKVRLDVHHAMDMAIGTEKTSSIATRHGAVAAINAGFFRLDKSVWAGDAAGPLVVNGDVLSESNINRSALGILNNPTRTDVSFALFQLERFLVLRSRTLSIGLNRETKSDDLVEYTGTYGSSTPAGDDRTEFVIRKRKVVRVTEGGNTRIGTGESVLSATGDKAKLMRESVRIGSKLKFHDVFASENATIPNTFLNVEDVTNGVPQLIKNSNIDITWEQEKASKSFVETRHPRTAVAKLKDGKFLMVTVDGRSAESAGIDLYDLAKLLLEFGSTDAMNLDGGGSTTMFLDGKVVNKPSDPTGERKVGDAILVTLRKPKR